MTDIALPPADRERLLDAFDAWLVEWRDSDRFADAVSETVARTGYAASDVRRQLRHLVERCRAGAMRTVRELELGIGADDAIPDAPGSVLVLAAGTVPGLALEGVAAALALGSVALVRPSSAESVLPHLLDGLGAWQPQLAGRIQLVGTGRSEPTWSRAGACIVFGNDATIAMVRDRLAPDAAARVAAYGSRQAIAVVAGGADVDPSWARRLADDVLCFHQRGCMSPSWLFALGDDATTGPLVDQVGRELVAGRDRHVTPGGADAAAQRHASDADVLGAIAAGLAADPVVLYAGDAQLTVVRVADEQALHQQVAALGSLLQTAVLACAREARPLLTELLLDAGVTRVCLAGDAHLPHPAWPQDGIGRLAPLVGRPLPTG